MVWIAWALGITLGVMTQNGTDQKTMLIVGGLGLALCIFSGYQLVSKGKK